MFIWDLFYPHHIPTYIIKYLNQFGKRNLLKKNYTLRIKTFSLGLKMHKRSCVMNNILQLLKISYELLKLTEIGTRKLLGIFSWK